MFKFLLILFIIGYVVFRIGGFLFRMLAGGLGAKTAYQQTYQSRNNQERKRKTNADGVSIEYAPENKSKRSASNFKGGEYVDYEEVK